MGSEPTKIFLVIQPDYDHEFHVAVFSSLAAAEAFIARAPEKHRGEVGIEELTLDPEVVPGAYGIQLSKTGAREYWSWIGTAGEASVIRAGESVEVYGATPAEARELAQRTLDNSTPEKDANA